MLVPQRTMPKCSVPFYDPFVTTAGLFWVHGTREGVMSADQADQRETLRPHAHPSFGKGQALVCSGSDMPCLCRCHPMAWHLCGGQARLFLTMSHISNLRPLKDYSGSKYQKAFCFRMSIYWSTCASGFMCHLISSSPIAVSPFHRIGEVCDMPKVTQLLGGREGGYRGLSSHHTWLCAQTGQTDSWGST